MSLIIYTKTGCPWCAEALQFLDENNVTYEEREVRANATYFEELKTKSGQEKTPTLDLDGTILVDTDATAIEIFLKENGVLS
jgi:glutaredoxin